MVLRTIAVLTSIFLSAATPAGPVYPPFGLDTTARDTSTKPGDDFYQYANGAYIGRLVIPSDRPSAGRIVDTSKRTEEQLQNLLEAAAKVVPEQPADIRGKVGAFYAAFMDESAIEASGVKPIMPELDAIRSATDRDMLAGLMGQPGLYPRPFDYFIRPDAKNPAVYATTLVQSGLGLPDRNYYVMPDFAAPRTAYRDYAATLLRLVGWNDSDALADAILAFETRIAEVSWTTVQRRDPNTQYNPMSQADLIAYAPGFSWKPFLDAARLGDKKRLIVTTNTSFPKIAAIIADTPVPTLKAWMAFRVADKAAPYLSHAFVDARFQLRDHTLNGLTELPPRWRRGIATVGGGDCLVNPDSCFGTLNWAVGQLYTDSYFPKETKAAIEALVANIKSAYRVRLEKLEWMGPTSKAEALRKLDTVTIKVGYPDKRRDYSGVVIRRDDLLGNVRRAQADEWEFQLGRSDGPVDRSDWTMTPQTIDAYTNMRLRDIVFPAAILQAPTFDAPADPAINYGGIGAVIGHELTHGFDDQGRKTDAAGALRDWWTPADAEEFTARSKVLGGQYAQYEPVPGMHIDPNLTMGENIGDLGGVSIALDAYHASLHGKPAPVLEGLTGDQRFFLGYAQVWARKTTPESIRKLTASDPHSYAKFRVNGVVRNIDAWYAAFDVKPDQSLYIPESKRARIW